MGSEETMKEKEDNLQKDIDRIRVNPANFEYIASTGKINGTLLNDIQLVLKDKYAELQALREEKEDIELKYKLLLNERNEQTRVINIWADRYNKIELENERLKTTQQNF